MTLAYDIRQALALPEKDRLPAVQAVCQRIDDAYQSTDDYLCEADELRTKLGEFIRSGKDVLESNPFCSRAVLLAGAAQILHDQLPAGNGEYAIDELIDNMNAELDTIEGDYRDIEEDGENPWGKHEDADDRPDWSELCQTLTEIAGILDRA
jgi:hypothetical protein